MKKLRKWKPGGRSRQKSKTKKGILKHKERFDNADKTEPVLPPMVPYHRKKEA